MNQSGTVAEYIGNALLEEWGYMSWSTWAKQEIGDVLPEAVFYSLNISLKRPVVVIGHSTASEWMEQHRFLGGTLLHPPYPYFYRVTAE